MRLDANTNWFTFTSEAIEGFSVYAFEGWEKAHEPYEFYVELTHASSNLDTLSLLGKPACLGITDRSGEKRFVHGLIQAVEQLHTGHNATHYNCRLVPRLWFLGENSNFRIFQQLSIVEIITQILSLHGFSADSYSMKLFFEYEPREYCVQYGESDLYFLSRLCEEEGIFYYFEHEKNAHCICFSDREGGPKIAGESSLRFFGGSGQVEDSAVINGLTFNHGVNSNAVTYREWNFAKPRLDLERKKKEPDTAKAPTPAGMLLEIYQYPHLYKLQKAGDQYAEIEMLRELSFRTWVEVTSDVSRFIPGHTFSVYEHPRANVNSEWWITEVYHNGKQPGVLEHAAPDRGLEYSSRATAIPESTRFIPKLKHPKLRVQGDESAIVTGPKGEEIYTDELDRVKVQFWWEREAKWNENSSCWVRVSHGLAGSSFGTMGTPRIGHEVIVSFEEGDPDRPFIDGALYHALNRPPYKLPENKTRTVFKTLSSLGGEGFNEIHFEDKAGEERIYAHAQKDTNLYVKNDSKEHILHDRHLNIGNASYAEIHGEEHQTVITARQVKLKENHLTVHGDSHTQTDGRRLITADSEIHLESLQKGVLEAGMDLTFKSGSNFVRINGAGLQFQGPISMADSVGSGSGASPLLPGKPKLDERMPVPLIRQTMALRASAGKPFCPICDFWAE